MKRENRDTIYKLLWEEEKSEYNYRIDSDNDMSYLRTILRAELDFIQSNEKGIDLFVSMEIFKETMAEFNITLEELKED